MNRTHTFPIVGFLSRPISRVRLRSALALLGVLAIALQPLVPMVANACLVSSGQAEVCANCNMEKVEAPSCHDAENQSANCHDNGADGSCCELEATDSQPATSAFRAIILDRVNTTLPIHTGHLASLAIPAESRVPAFYLTPETYLSNAPPYVYLSNFLRL